MTDEQKKAYGVRLPIAGVIFVEVEASSEEEAIEVALSNSLEHSDIEEWDAYRQLSRGNVLYAPLNEAEAEEIY